MLKIRIPIYLILVTCAVFICTGCNKTTVQDSLWSQLKELGQEKTDLKMKVDQLEKENKDLRMRLDTLSAIDGESRQEALAGLNKIEIGKRSGFFDKDNDGKTETLIVYIKPTDAIGDVVKIPGSVNVQLWDLNTKGKDALLGEWNMPPEELKKHWSNTLMTRYYRLTYPVADLIDGKNKELTIKIGFTDYATGRVIRDQKAFSL